MNIVDARTRPLRNVRISVIDQCNLRCNYCMPKEVFDRDYTYLQPQQLLSFQEIERLTRIFVSLGVEKIRLTGGEPLMRKGLPELIERLLLVNGIQDVSLTTNGILLGVYAERLKRAGLKRINVSLDSLNAATHDQMNGRYFPLEKVLASIEKAANLGLKIKVNMVVQKGINDADILPMAAYCFDKGYTLRFIEYMDVGNTNRWDLAQVMPSKEILQLLKQSWTLEPVTQMITGDVAKRYRYAGTEQEVGFISSVTEAFCADCNRARISADGKLYTCLFATTGTDIKGILRNGSDEEVRGLLSGIWQNRHDRYSEERGANVRARSKIEMSYIGG
ncbi:MAG: GTP 3',8-cyclase MoaA [Solibacillus sp.]